jgi:hypothetical protein
VATGDQRSSNDLAWQCIQAQRKKFVLGRAAGEIATFVHGVKLIPRANIQHELAACLDHLAAEIFVLDADYEQRRLVGNAERAKGELHIALALVRCRDEIKPGRCDAVCLRQWHFM